MKKEFIHFLRGVFAGLIYNLTYFGLYHLVVAGHLRRGNHFLISVHCYDFEFRIENWELRISFFGREPRKKSTILHYLLNQNGDNLVLIYENRFLNL